MDLSDVVNYGTVASWVFGAILFIGRIIESRKRGEPMTPAWLPKALASNVVLGLIITLGLVGSLTQAYLYYKHPKIVEKIVEKPVDRVVERVVEKQVPCPSKPRQTAKTQTTSKPTPDNSSVLPGWTSIAQCPPNMSVVDITNSEFAYAGKSGLHIDGPVCLISHGGFYVHDNREHDVDLENPTPPSPK